MAKADLPTVAGWLTEPHVARSWTQTPPPRRSSTSTELIRGDWIRLGAVVIDAGYNPGDVKFEAASHRAGRITPVPGAVGPTTIAVLLALTVDAAFAR